MTKAPMDAGAVRRNAEAILKYASSIQLHCKRSHAALAIQKCYRCHMVCNGRRDPTGHTQPACS